MATNGFGFPAAKLAMETAVSMAKDFGSGMVSVKHSNHFGTSAWIVQQAVDAGMLCLVFTNSSPALLHLGRARRSSSACRPSRRRQAPARERAALHPRHGAERCGTGEDLQGTQEREKIPGDWALDGEGKSTDDPEKALQGVMLPMGGPKGSAPAIMMDVFSGVLSGSAFAGGVRGPYDMSRPADVGHFIVAIKPDLLRTANGVQERMDVLYQKGLSARRKRTAWIGSTLPARLSRLEKRNDARTASFSCWTSGAALNAEAAKWG